MFGSKARRQRDEVIALLIRRHEEISTLRTRLDAAYAEVGALRTQAYRDGILWAVDEMQAQANVRGTSATVSFFADAVDHVKLCAEDFARDTAVPHRERSDGHNG